MRGRGGLSLRLLLVGVLAIGVGLFGVSVSGAAPPTEADVKGFDQCANGAPPSAATDCPEKWINGILNTSNSHYAEDEVTAQRVVLVLPKNGSTTGRTVEMSFLTRKGGAHAYDSLATWNRTQTSADRCADLNAAYCVPGPATTFPIPADPTVVADANGAGGATSAHQLGGQEFTMYGGTITAVSSYTHHDPGGTSDSYAHVTLTYDVGAPGTLDAEHTVMLLFGGHIAASLGPRGWGVGVGAGSISGGPYHVRITSADGSSVGNRDNQIMSGAILAPANLVIHKVAVGGDAAFDYTSTGGLSPSAFSIATSGGAGGQSFTDLPAGAYTVTESALPAGWDFTGLSCTDDDGGTTVAGQTANVDLDPGETVSCTYTNTKRGRILVDKVTAPAGDPESFPFALTGGPDSLNQVFSLTDSAAPHDSDFVKPGAYAVAETTAPGGWDLTSSTCSDGSAPGAVALEAGEIVTCTFTNTKRATLVVYKQVVNDDGGGATASAWQMDVSGPTPLGFPGSATGTSNEVLPGSYTVGESGGPAGYDGPSYPTTGLPAGVSLNDCDAQGAVVVGAGETKRCVLRNDDRPATLTVIKHVVNDNGGTKTAADFPIQVTGSSPDPASFPGAESPGTSVALGAGSYAVTETEDPGYSASYSAGCTGAIAPGEAKTCTITNDDRAPRLTLVKEVVNDDGGSSLASAWTLTADGPTGFAGLGPSVSSGAGFDQGSYDLSEDGPAGYEASDWSCTDGQVDADTVEVALGEDVTCTIVNDDVPARLVVRKVVVNDNGGTRAASDFGFQVNGGAVQPFEADGQNELVVDAGVYSVTEPPVAGYRTSYDNCSGLVIPSGGTGTCTITNDDLPAGIGAIDVQKSADPTSMKEPGGPVTFSVTIANVSPDVDVAIESVVDDVYGDLDDEGGSGCFDVPVNLAPGEKVTCTFQRNVTGAGGTVHVNTVRVEGHDEFGHSVSDSDDARVEITPRLIDLVIVKDATSPTPLNGIVQYSLAVTNRGPDPATNVQIADPAPAGIVYQSAVPEQGSCALAPSLVTCSLGTIAPGQTVRIAITARATLVGTHTNTATVTGSGGRETNPADNVDDAVTVVPAPLRPPTVAPKPAPKVEICLSLTVAPKMIKADGKPDRVVARVRALRKPMRGAKVLIRGAGVRKSGLTNARGVAVITVNPRKPGLLTITTLERQRSCGAKRIGVVGVFLPPLTG